MQSTEKCCSECGEPIGEARLRAVPDAAQCIHCASQTSDLRTTAAPKKTLPSKPIVTTHHLKRYLSNVGQKADARSLFRTLVRLSYLFPQVSAAEMTPIIVNWAKSTNSHFDQEQLLQMILDAKKWAVEHPGKKT